MCISCVKLTLVERSVEVSQAEAGISYQREKCGKYHNKSRVKFLKIGSCVCVSVASLVTREDARSPWMR